MPRQLPPDIWFVRSNGGSGSYPVTPEGWRLTRRFLTGLIGWGIAAGLLATVGAVWGPSWLVVTSALLFAAGAALSAWQFIDAARKHTDYALTYSDYMKDDRNA
jgi:protein-S-isoprenylcysteine O-methyltransferase Ste14